MAVRKQLTIPNYVALGVQRQIIKNEHCRQYGWDKDRRASTLGGVNSRLDEVQAAVLRVKLRYLDGYNLARQRAAAVYDRLFAGVPELTTPPQAGDRVHVFHQYTLRVGGGVDRDGLSSHLISKGIANAIYYPVPLHQLEAYACEADGQPGSGEARSRRGPLPETERAAAEVISLPMHSELSEPIQQEIADAVLEFVSGRVATA